MGAISFFLLPPTIFITFFHAQVIEHFKIFLRSKYAVKLLGLRTFLHEWIVNYPSDGSIIIYLPYLVLTTISNAFTASITFHQTPYRYSRYLRPPMIHDTPLLSIVLNFRDLVGDCAIWVVSQGLAFLSSRVYSVGWFINPQCFIGEKLCAS